MVFRGTPGDGDVGTLQLSVEVSDSAHQLASDVFELTVRNPNDTSPLVLNALADQTVRQNEGLEFVIPDNSFIDLDVGDRLSYTVRMLDGQPLVRWLSFDAERRLFTGTPGKDDGSTVTAAAAAPSTALRFVSTISTTRHGCNAWSMTSPFCRANWWT
ncbi:MAG: putative Ig domain-containing protein [Pseudomonadota bacterium]